ncbi:MAG: hypothetical protein NTW38_11350 [Candidatus Aminicenantes bacterium]|nr:hypothetical protein [Candidatus Aminicenantes bacterium]
MKTPSLVFVCLLGFSFLILADAPAENVVKSLTIADSTSFQEVSPLDFSMIVSAGALSSREGKKIEVFLSNGAFSLKQMANGWVLPLKSKEEFILVLTFLNGNGPVVDGEYSPKAGYGKSFYCYAEVRVLSGPQGTNISLDVAEGKAVLTGITSGKITGSFQLLRKNADKTVAETSGTFDVPLTVEK